MTAIPGSLPSALKMALKFPECLSSAALINSTLSHFYLQSVYVRGGFSYSRAADEGSNMPAHLQWRQPFQSCATAERTPNGCQPKLKGPKECLTHRCFQWQQASKCCAAAAAAAFKELSTRLPAEKLLNSCSFQSKRPSKAEQWRQRYFPWLVCACRMSATSNTAAQLMSEAAGA